MLTVFDLGQVVDMVEVIIQCPIMVRANTLTRNLKEFRQGDIEMFMRLWKD